MEDNLTLYTKYWLPFGELLTDMERVGIAVDKDYLRTLQLRAIKDKAVTVEYEKYRYDVVYHECPYQV